MSETTYLWLVFWDDSFVQPQRVEVREVTRLPDVADADLERHLVDVAVAEEAGRATRSGGVRSQVLLRLGGERTRATGYGAADEGVATPVGTVAVAIGRSAEVVWRSDAADEVGAPTG